MNISEKDYIALLHCASENGSIDICEFCKHYIKCSGEECECFISGVGDAEGKYPNWKWTCEDFDFGTCPKLENTPCNGCIIEKTFEWNGKLYKENET